MIPCKDIHPLLSAYLDRQLAPTELTDVRLHLDTCAACRAEERSILQLKEALRSVTMPSIPADLLASIEAETIFKPRWWEVDVFQQRWAPVMLGIAMGLGAWFFMSRTKTPIRAASVQMALSPALSTAPVVAMHRDQEPDFTEKIH